MDGIKVNLVSEHSISIHNFVKVAPSQISFSHQLDLLSHSRDFTISTLSVQLIQSKYVNEIAQTLQFCWFKPVLKCFKQFKTIN